MPTPMDGYVAAGFEEVRDVFTRQLETGLDLGAAFAVYRHGRPLVDLWGGWTGPERVSPAPADGLYSLWSTSKGVAALAVAVLVELGRLDYDAPVAAYWPEFGRQGKGTVTVAQLMSHQAGLCGPRAPTTLEDYLAHDDLAERLAAQEPFFAPGSAWGYHTLSYGTLADELCRRADGRPIGAVLADEVAGPLGVDVFLGLPEDQDPRHLRLHPASDPDQLVVPNAPNPAAQAAALSNPPLDPLWPDRREWRAFGLASAGGVADARGLARAYAALVSGKLVSDAVLRDASRERVRGLDQVNGVVGRYAAGFALNLSGAMGPHPEAFGHLGWGGSLAFADPTEGIGVAYVTNQMRPLDPKDDPRAAALVRAVFTSLSRS